MVVGEGGLTLGDYHFDLPTPTFRPQYLFGPGSATKEFEGRSLLMESLLMQKPVEIAAAGSYRQIKSQPLGVTVEALSPNEELAQEALSLIEKVLGRAMKRMQSEGRALPRIRLEVFEGEFYRVNDKILPSRSVSFCEDGTFKSHDLVLSARGINCQWGSLNRILTKYLISSEYLCL